MPVMPVLIGPSLSRTVVLYFVCGMGRKSDGERSVVSIAPPSPGRNLPHRTACPTFIQREPLQLALVLTLLATLCVALTYVWVLAGRK
jgi:hypothetical protein